MRSSDAIDPLELTAAQILAHRRRAQALDERLARGGDAYRRAASAGLQDSVPRSALHSLHARVQGVRADALDDASLVQVWGPRFTAYVVPSDAHLPFTLGRLPESGRIRRRAEDLADRLRGHLDGRRVPYGQAGRALGVHPNMLRYAALTGTVLIRWQGARQPMIWTVPPPETDPLEARLELVRRYLHVHGPSTVDAFIRWGGVGRSSAIAAWDTLRPSLIAVRTPIGDAHILATDEPSFREGPAATDAVRLLPSGDPYFLLWGADRELLVPEVLHRAELWTPRVWPGALLVGGEIAGIWRRAGTAVLATPWRRLSAREQRGVEAEAASLPLPDVNAPITVRWER